MGEYTINKLKTLRLNLDTIGKQVGRVRDQLRSLLDDAEHEFNTVEEAKVGLDQVIDKLSEHH